MNFAKVFSKLIEIFKHINLEIIFRRSFTGMSMKFCKNVGDVLD